MSDVNKKKKIMIVTGENGTDGRDAEQDYTLDGSDNLNLAEINTKALDVVFDKSTGTLTVGNIVITNNEIKTSITIDGKSVININKIGGETA
ncbi:hypothetical protein ACFQZR_14555 [Paenibacillus sp. GCM10027629]|uniref:hypothetical protein n=1 Tax=Paenibacillus sp. GCM10027629 TaxID=3273414 RepID=UPI00363E401F